MDRPWTWAPSDPGPQRSRSLGPASAITRPELPPAARTRPARAPAARAVHAARAGRRGAASPHDPASVAPARPPVARSLPLPQRLRPLRRVGVAAGAPANKSPLLGGERTGGTALPQPDRELLP